MLNCENFVYATYEATPPCLLFVVTYGQLGRSAHISTHVTERGWTSISHTSIAQGTNIQCARWTA